MKALVALGMRRSNSAYIKRTKRGGRTTTPRPPLYAVAAPEIWTAHSLDVVPSYGSRFEGLCYRNLLAYTIP